MTSTDDICKRCKSINTLITVYGSGEVVCSNCGLVHEQFITETQYENRAFENDGSKKLKRIDTPTKNSDGNFGTKLYIKGKALSNLIAINRVNTKEKTRTQKNFSTLQHQLEKKDISKEIIENCKMLYERIEKFEKKQKRKIGEKKLESMIPALYYIVARSEKISLTFKELARIFYVPENFKREREFKIRKEFNKIKWFDPDDFSPKESIISHIYSFCIENKESCDFLSLAKKIAENIEKSYLLEGRRLTTISGCALFLAYQISNYTNSLEKKKIITEKYGESGTSDKIFNILKPHLNKIIPENYQNNIQNINRNVY